MKFLFHIPCIVPTLLAFSGSAAAELPPASDDSVRTESEAPNSEVTIMEGDSLPRSPEAEAPAEPSEVPAPAAPEESKPEAAHSHVELAPAPEKAAAEPSPGPQVLKAQFGKGFIVGTTDEKFTLNIRGRLQVQALYADEPGDGGEVTQVQARRMRLLFQGNLLGEKLQYYFQLGFSNRDQEPDLRMPLRDAYITYAPFRDLSLRFGQMKVPYGRQRVTSSSALGMVDRSLVITELTLDRDVGVYAFSKDLFGLGGRVGYSIGVFGGDGRNRLAQNAGLLYVARINLTPLGPFEDNVEASLEFDPKPHFAIGFGGGYNQATNRPNSTTGLPYADPNIHFDYASLGADFMFKWHGFFAMAEWMWRDSNKAEEDGVDADGDPFTYVARRGWGAFGQLGQMLTRHLEVSARYGYIEPLGEVSATPLIHEIGGGVSYYFLGHSLKLQADYFYISHQADLSQGLNQGRLQAQVYF